MLFTVLASGSSGNANLVRTGNFGLLIDVGLGPQRLAGRLRTVGSSWAEINAVLLSHVHADHWKDRSLRFLRQNKIPLYCHADHEVDLIRFTPAVGPFARQQSAAALPGTTRKWLWKGVCPFRAFRVSHDSQPTCGFRVDWADRDTRLRGRSGLLAAGPGRGIGRRGRIGRGIQS